MGRPLNKKYFGDRNIGTNGYEIDGSLSNSQNYADDRIGGEGVASITLDGSEGQGQYTNTVPTVTFKAPSIPGGVTAVAGDVHVFAKSATIGTTGNAYHYSDTLTLSPDGVWSGTQMSFTVTSLQTVGVTILNDGSACDTGDKFRFDGSYDGGSWTTPLEVLVTSSSGGNVTGFTVTQAGVWTGSATPTNTTGATRTQIAAGSDWNGTDLQFNLTGWGVNQVEVAEAGDHTAVSGNVTTSVSTTVSPTGGTGAKLFVQYGVSSVEIAEKGSGYINVADAQPTFSSADIWTASGASVLTTDSGGYINTSGDNMNTNNQENAIMIYANTDGEGVALGDIIKQTNARSYKVNNGSSVGICKLVDTDNPAEGEAYITATDSDGGTYYVTKLTAHKALLVQHSGSQFATGQSVKWTFGAAEEDYSVTVENA